MVCMDRVNISPKATTVQRAGSYERVADNMGDAADDSTDKPGIFKVRQKFVGNRSGDERPETF